MIARWTGHIAPGTVTSFIAWHGDLLMTLADLSRAPRVPPGLDSISLVPTLLGHPDQQAEHDWLYWDVELLA